MLKKINSLEPRLKPWLKFISVFKHLAGAEAPVPKLKVKKKEDVYRRF